MAPGGNEVGVSGDSHTFSWANQNLFSPIGGWLSVIVVTAGCDEKSQGVFRLGCVSGTFFSLRTPEEHPGYGVTSAISSPKGSRVTSFAVAEAAEEITGFKLVLLKPS